MKLCLAKKSVLKLVFFQFLSNLLIFMMHFKNFFVAKYAHDMNCNLPLSRLPEMKKYLLVLRTESDSLSAKDKHTILFHNILTITIYQLLWPELLWILQYIKKISYINKLHVYFAHYTRNSSCCSFLKTTLILIWFFYLRQRVVIIQGNYD